MKKLISLLLCLILLFGPISVITPARATSEGDWEYMVNSGKTTITKYTGSAGDVTIPSKLGGNPVTQIGRNAFSRCTSLTAVNIPNSVTSIGSNAFNGCTNLTTVIIPESVISIGSFAFEDCIGLTSITIPKSVTNIGSFAFEDCDGIKRVDINDLAAWCSIDFDNHSANPLDYAHALYLNGKIVTKLSIPVGSTSIGSYAFSGCSTIKSVSIPESVTRIGEGAFFKCSELSSVIIPPSVTCINDRTFEDCKGLVSITIPSGVTSIGSSAFKGCEMLTSVDIPRGVTCINRSTFEDCSCLASITIPPGVTSIDFAAFDGCKRLTNVSIPKGVQSIGGHSFSNCSGLTELSIPSGVVSIGDFAFSLCSNLSCVSIPTSLKSIGESAFAGCSLTSLIIPANVTVIGENAFHYCENLMSAGPIGSGCDIEFGWTESIPDYAFSGCPSIHAVIIPGTIVEIRHSVFSGCSNLEHIYFGGTKAQWEEILLFGNNDPLENAELHYGYKTGDPLITASGSCGDNLTWNLDHKGRLTVSGIGTMNSSPFDYSTRKMIRTVVINSGVTNISSYAFLNCNNLTSVTIPSSVNDIESCAFSGCNSLESIYFGSTQTDWEKVSIYSYGNDSLHSANIHYAEPLAISVIKANKTATIPGETITWTASAAGGSGTLRYCFYVYKDGAVVRKTGYGAAASVSYTPEEAGTYKVKAFVKDGAGISVSGMSGNTLVSAAALPLTVTGLTVSKTAASPGETLTWTVSAEGGTGTLRYNFYICRDGAVVQKTGYTAAKTASWTAAEAGKYSVKVFVKDSAANIVTQSGGSVTVAAPAGPLAVTAVTANKTSAAAGDTITWTASAEGGTGTLRYNFYICKDGTVVQKTGYTTARTASWTAAEAGNYAVKVYVKDSAGTAVSLMSGNTVVGADAAPSLAVTGITADKTSAAAGETVTWTASASGSGTLRYCFYVYKDGAVVQKTGYGAEKTLSFTAATAGVYQAKVFVKDVTGAAASRMSAKLTVTG